MSQSKTQTATTKRINKITIKPTKAQPIRLLECGCCGQFHPAGPLLPGGSANYMNDCRYDANRFNSAEEYTERTGYPAVEVWLDEQNEEESL